MTTYNPLKLNSKFILPLSLFYLTVLLTADALSFKFTSYHGFTLSGATIIFPLTFLLGDIITEVYGYDTARKLLWLCIFYEILFGALIKVVIALPYPSFANYLKDFETVDGDILTFILSGVISNVIASFLNIYLISKWKIKLKGKYFWLRSLFSTAISELVIAGLCVFIGFSSRMTLDQLTNTFISTYSVELLWSIIFVLPAWRISIWLKRMEGIDAYDNDVIYNPFYFFKVSTHKEG